jgi:hypothetical protein
MSKEITFTISGTKKELNRTSITKIVWDEVAGTLELSGLHDELDEVIRYCGEHQNHLEAKGVHQQTGRNVGGVAELTAHCILNGASPEEKAKHLEGFISHMATNKYITQADMLRAKSELGLQNVKTARAV